MTEKAFIYTVTEDGLIIKKKSAAKMLFVLVCILAGVTGSQGSYIPPTLPLGISHTLLVHRDIVQTQLSPRGISYAVLDTPEKDVSYSLSYKDYLYLKRHKIEGQDSPFNPDPEPIPTTDGIKENKHDNIKHDVPRLDARFKRSVGTNSLNRCKKVFVSPPKPEVHKNVYFHVPPPDFEDTPPIPRVIQPAKKNIKILFIKAPSYDSNRAHLQQLLLNQQAPIEDKTLIYVLSKKEDLLPPEPVVLPPKPSTPEVYFVKYKTNGIGSINNELSLPRLLQNPVLERKRKTVIR